MVKVFLSHTWKPDQLNRATHQRVIQVRDALLRLNIESWLDQDHMVHDIDNCMAVGIDTSDVVIIFLTREYVDKVQNAASNPSQRDNCYKEFSYAHSSCKVILPVVFEPCMRSVATWPNGIVKMHLGSNMYVDGADASPRDIAYDIYKMLRRSQIAMHTNPDVTDLRVLPSRRPMRVAPLMQTKNDKAVQVCSHDITSASLVNFWGFRRLVTTNLRRTSAMRLMPCVYAQKRPIMQLVNRIPLALTPSKIMTLSKKPSIRSDS